MKAKIIIMTGIIILILIGLFYINLTGNVIKNNEKIKIGIMTPTTGNLAFLGENIVNSAKLAVKEQGLDDKVELIVEDTGYLGGGGNVINSYNKLVQTDKVQVIIDGMTSDGSMTVAPLLDIDKIVMITPLTGGENIDNSAEYMFRNGPSDIIAGNKPAEDLYYTFGYKNVVLFTDNSEYTIDISKHFRRAYKGKIVYDEIITPDLTDYRTQIAKIPKETNAIVINTASGVSAGYIIKQLHESGNKLPIFCNFIAFNDKNFKIASKEAFQNIYIYNPEFDENSNLTKDFLKKYNEKYGKNPAIPFHTTGTYDAIKMISEAVENVGYSGKAVHFYLLNNIKNWHGMNGIVSFDVNGNTATGFLLKQVKKGKLEIYNS